MLDYVNHNKKPNQQGDMKQGYLRRFAQFSTICTI